MPLISGDTVEVEEVVLDKPTFIFEKLKDGSGNWQIAPAGGSARGRRHAGAERRAGSRWRHGRGHQERLDRGRHADLSRSGDRHRAEGREPQHRSGAGQPERPVPGRGRRHRRQHPGRLPHQDRRARPGAADAARPQLHPDRRQCHDRLRRQCRRGRGRGPEQVDRHRQAQRQGRQRREAAGQPAGLVRPRVCRPCWPRPSRSTATSRPARPMPRSRISPPTLGDLTRQGGRHRRLRGGAEGAGEHRASAGSISTN